MDIWGWHQAVAAGALPPACLLQYCGFTTLTDRSAPCGHPGSHGYTQPDASGRQRENEKRKWGEGVKREVEKESETKEDGREVEKEEIRVWRVRWQLQLVADHALACVTAITVLLCVVFSGAERIGFRFPRWCYNRSTDVRSFRLRVSQISLCTKNIGFSVFIKYAAT